MFFIYVQLKLFLILSFNIESIYFHFLVLMVAAEAMRVNQVLPQHMRGLPLHLQPGQEVREVPVEQDQEMVNLQKVVIDVYFTYILSFSINRKF